MAKYSKTHPEQLKPFVWYKLKYRDSIGNRRNLLLQFRALGVEEKGKRLILIFMSQDQDEYEIVWENVVGYTSMV